MAISETQQRILEALNEAYPDWADPSELRDIPLKELARNARYLEERGLIDVNWTESIGEPAEPVLMKIRADGIDVLRDQPPPPPPLVPIPQFISEGDVAARLHAERQRRFAAATSHTETTPLLPTTEASARSTPSTVSEAVTRNRIAVQTTGAAFLVAIENRLAYLRDARLNTPEAQKEIEACEQLKSRAEEFLEAAAGMLEQRPDESKLRALLDAFADRLTHWVKEEKDFNDAMKLVMFLTGVGVCCAAGVPVLGTAFAGAIIGGTKVSESVGKILKAWRQ